MSLRAMIETSKLSTGFVERAVLDGSATLLGPDFRPWLDRYGYPDRMGNLELQPMANPGMSTRLPLWAHRVGPVPSLEPTGYHTIPNVNTSAIPEHNVSARTIGRPTSIQCVLTIYARYI